MFGICFISTSFGLSLFVSKYMYVTTEIINGCIYVCYSYSEVLGISWVGSTFGVLAAVFILLGANADDPDFFMQNHIIQVWNKIKTFL